MDNHSYDDIRAYFDYEIPEAMARLADDPMLPPALAFAFPDIDVTLIREKIRACRTIAQIQSEIMFPVIKRIIDLTINNLRYSGIEHITPNDGRLFISNHRDITLDPLLLEYLLFSHNLATSDIALGENLLRPRIVAEICKANYMVKVIRKDDVSPREFLENSRHLTEYIRLRIEKGRTMWIAQRNGRAKDGRDATEQGLLKMLGMSGDGDFARDFGRLRITPIAISYQYETCDVEKALELTVTRSGKAYQKHKNEDFESIMRGITSQKGDVTINVCRPISDEELAEMATLPKAEAYKALTDAIDRRIIEAYSLHDTNYIAHDILHNERRYEEYYTAEQEATFRTRLAEAEARFGDKVDVAREIYLGIYANPIDSKKALQ